MRSTAVVCRERRDEVLEEFRLSKTEIDGEAIFGSDGTDDMADSVLEVCAWKVLLELEWLVVEVPIRAREIFWERFRKRECPWLEVLVEAERLIPEDIADEPMKGSWERKVGGVGGKVVERESCVHPLVLG